MTASRNRGTDPVLLVQAALSVLLVILFIFLYIAPTERRLYGMQWWSPVLIGGLALAILLLDSWRRKRRYRRGMEEMVEEHLGKDG